MKKSLEELRHDRSKKDFPFLSLEEDEYVELAISRSKVGLFFIWFFVIVAILLLTLCILTFSNDFHSFLAPIAGNTFQLLSLVLFILYLVILVVGAIGTKVHFGNKLFITNKRAIQISVSGLFTNSTNVVELSRIEDVSFKQVGFIQTAFHYGTIRMSTVGDETTYTFPFVDTPTDEIQTISHLVHIQKGKN